MSRVLILGSAPNAAVARDWPHEFFDAIVVINNAWRIRDDWTHLIHPEDFPAERQPLTLSRGQKIVTYRDYVPAQNRYGGFVYAGGTMAFTAGYWALAALKPKQICYFGCDMVYPKSGNTHFYGTGTADPLRNDPTLSNLLAKACRLEYFASDQGCTLLNLSPHRSVLPYAHASLDMLDTVRFTPRFADHRNTDRALWLEATAGYFVQSGRYWEAEDRFSPRVIAEIDHHWCAAYAPEALETA